MIVGGNQSEILAAALRGLEAQRQAAEHNIANVETPGFKARRVSFEQALREAIESGDPSRATISTSLKSSPTRIDGSNVDLEDEVTSLEVNALQQQLITEALNSRYTRLRTSIGSR
ncbi:MAG: flagellar basal body rod protein FlgB [Acidimicrobiales bacterium]